MNKTTYQRYYLRFFFIAFAMLTSAHGFAMTLEKSLDFAGLGTVKIQVTIPDEALRETGASLPVVLLVSGFQTSKQLASTMGESFGKNILIAYEYPLDDKMDWLDWSDPTDTSLAALIPTIPLQIVNILNWIRTSDLVNEFGVQADLQKVDVVTISLGTFFVPMALRLAQLQGIYENSVVFAYGGANLHDVAQNQVRLAEGAAAAQFLSPIIQAVISPFEPTNYIQDVHPRRFLILNAQDDQIFTQSSQQALVNATPNPKDIVSVPGVHIGLDQTERVNATIDIIRRWFLKNDAINN